MFSRSCFIFAAGLIALAGVASAQSPTAASVEALPVADGFAGVWYSIGQEIEVDGVAYPKYSGGLSTYPQQIHPIAVYAPRVKRTFFVLGARKPDKNELQYLVSYFDHKTQTVARPRVLDSRDHNNNHENPSLAIDADGHLMVFANVHGEHRRSHLWRSVEPYGIERFKELPLPEDVFPEHRFNYAQPWHVPGEGILLLHTRYTGHERDLHLTRSADGRTWSARQTLSQMESGQYQISWQNGQRVSTVFNVHPPKGIADGPAGVDSRTNLYYLQTDDAGRTWTTAAGEPVSTPITNSNNPALIHDYRADNRLVYLKDINFDQHGRPVVLYLTAGGHDSGPQFGPRILHTAHFDGSEWVIRNVLETTQNYDHGSLYIEEDGTWRIIGPFLEGPQKWATGGHVGVWTSIDQGKTWKLQQQVTRGGKRNHTYVRRPLNAHKDFYAFWADGHGLEEGSGSDFHFTNQAGDQWLRLPRTFSGPTAKPDPITSP